MRTVMGALNRVYDADRDQSLPERFGTSLALAAEVTALILLALAVIHLGPLLLPVDGVVLGVLSAIVRWGLAGALLLLAVGLVIRHGPDTKRPWHWVSFGSLVCCAGVVTSVAFGFYVTSIANYGSLFGSFATLFVVLTYVYLSAIAFLAALSSTPTCARRRRGRPTADAYPRTGGSRHPRPRPPVALARPPRDATRCSSACGCSAPARPVVAGARATRRGRCSPRGSAQHPAQRRRRDDRDSVAVLLAWFPLRQLPGLGTVLNAVFGSRST